MVSLYSWFSTAFLSKLTQSISGKHVLLRKIFSFGQIPLLPGHWHTPVPTLSWYRLVALVVRTATQSGKPV